MSEMVERVARAIFTAWAEHVGGDQPTWEEATAAYSVGPDGYPKLHDVVISCRKEARAAIEAMREPTENMVSSANWQERGTYAAWRAMIDAALATH